MPPKPKPKAIYRIASLGGEPIPVKEREDLLADAVKRGDKLLRAVLQIAEEELDTFRVESTDSKNLREGTQPHFCGGADSLNGFLLQVAETAEQGLRRA